MTWSLLVNTRKYHSQTCFSRFVSKHVMVAVGEKGAVAYGAGMAVTAAILTATPSSSCSCLTEQAVVCSYLPMLTKIH
jgi:hypothetical protein